MNPSGSDVALHLDYFEQHWNSNTRMHSSKYYLTIA